MFGILFNVGIFEFSGLSFASKTMFQKINEYIKDNNRSKKSPVKNFFNLAIDKFIYSNILNIAFFVMFIFAIIDYNTANHIKNSNLKINLNAITVTLIIIFFTVIAAQIYEEFKINVVEIPTLEKNVDEEDNGLIEELRNIITDVSKEMLEPILKEAGPLINETAQVVKNVNTIAENAENTLKETTSGISSATDTFNDAGKEYSNLIPTDTNVSNSTDIK
jgi:predicted PurR-regulated permease PerM